MTGHANGLRNGSKHQSEPRPSGWATLVALFAALVLAIIRHPAAVQAQCAILGTVQNPSTGDIFANCKLTAGYGLGLNTDQMRTDWLSCCNANCPDCCRMALPSGQNWGAVFITIGNPRQPPRPAADFSGFTHLEMELRGDQDGQFIQVGIKDACDADDGTETKLLVGPLSTTWTTYQFELSRFTGADLTRLYVLTEFVFDLKQTEPEAPQTTFFRNVRFIRVEPTATSTPTLPSTPTDTPCPTLTDTPTPTPTPTLGPCVGDCNDDGTVMVDELIKGANIALGGLLQDDCPSFDFNLDGQVTIDELLKGVNAAVKGCTKMNRHCLCVLPPGATCPAITNPAQRLKCRRMGVLFNIHRHLAGGHSPSTIHPLKGTPCRWSLSKRTASPTDSW